MINQSVIGEPALHEVYQLGPLVATYQTQTTRAGKLILWGATFLCLLSAGGSVGFIIWMELPEINEPFFSPFLVANMTGLTIILYGLLFFSFLLQLRVHIVLASPIRRKIVVSLYEQGLVYREGRKVQAAVWGQIRFIERLALPRTKMPRRYYKLHLKDASDITLPIVIAQVQKLGAVIENELLKRLLPGVLADFNAQKPIAFPGFCLNQDGVSKSDELLPWLHVEQVNLAKEKLTIKEKGVAKDWLSIPAAQVRNMCVLEALLVRIREDQGFRIDASVVMITG